MKVHVCLLDPGCRKVRRELGNWGPPRDRVHISVARVQIILSPTSRIQGYSWRKRQYTDKWWPVSVHPLSVRKK